MKAALKPNGTLIWSTTTPVPPDYKARNNSDVVRLNGLMKQLWASSGYDDVLTNDLYQQVSASKNQRTKY
jgi:hypothetical protein